MLFLSESVTLEWVENQERVIFVNIPSSFLGIRIHSERAGRVGTNLISIPDCLNQNDTKKVGLHGCTTGISKDEDLTPATNPGRSSFQEGAEFLVWHRTTARSLLTPTLFLDP